MYWLVFKCVFVVLFVLTNAIAPTVMASDSETATYHGVQPDAFMRSWLVLGPIPVADDESNPDENTQRKAFDADLLADSGGESSIRPAMGQAQKVAGETYTWQVIRVEKDVVTLIDIFGEKEFVVAYAWAEIDAPNATKALLGLGSNDGVKVWLNGQLIHQNWIGRIVRKDEDLVAVNFQAGKNQLLLKVQNMQRNWGFSCRVLVRKR